MRLLKSTPVVFLVIATLLFSGCSKYKLYNMALDSRRSGAELSVKKTTISIGEIVYLDNATIKDPKQNQDTVIMVHGFGGNKDNWVLLSDKMTQDYRIIALDLPGHGNSVSDTSLSYTIENQAKWLNEFMEALDIKKAHVIGNSMGGAICLKLTYLHADKVLSMTLLDSAGVYVAKSELILQLEKGINPLIAGTTDEYKKLMDFVMEKKPYIPGFAIAVMTEEKIARKSLDEKIFTDIRNDIGLIENRLSEIHTPTLIIWGDKDRVIHLDNAGEFHKKIQGSQLAVLSGIGHLPMVEDPKKTWETCKPFLAANKQKP